MQTLHLKESIKTIYLNKEDIHKGNLILINRFYPLKQKQNLISLMPVNTEFPDILLESTTVSVLQHLMKLIQCENEIIPVSGYRSFEEQKSIYSDSLEENGIEFTKKYVALPNHSEHQTGLAIDLTLRTSKYDFICPEFPYDGICKTFREQGLYHGFIERYPKGKEMITGIGHEPWHFRYVGYPHSIIMREKGFTLEEYIEFLSMYPYKRTHFTTKVKKQEVEIFYVDASIHTEIQLPEDAIYQISGNNIDGFIVTIWR